LRIPARGRFKPESKEVRQANGGKVFDKPYIHFKYFQEYEKEILLSTQNFTVLGAGKSA
jgi:hypothetical protein